MAERISRDQLKFGVPAIALRDAIKFMGKRRVRTAFFVERLKISESAAERLVKDLLDATWLKEDDRESGWYELTQVGHAYSHARATRPLRRAKAEQLLAGAIDAAKKVNADGSMPNYVGELYVFGSFLRDAPEIGDLDLGLKLERRLGKMSMDQWMKWSTDFGYANTSGRSYLDVLYYSDHAARKLIKQRSPYVSIHSIDDLDRIGAERKLAFKAGRVAAPRPTKEAADD